MQEQTEIMVGFQKRCPRSFSSRIVFIIYKFQVEVPLVLEKLNKLGDIAKELGFN